MFEGQKRLLDEDQGGQLSSSGLLCESCAELGDAGGSLLNLLHWRLWCSTHGRDSLHSSTELCVEVGSAAADRPSMVAMHSITPSLASAIWNGFVSCAVRTASCWIMSTASTWSMVMVAPGNARAPAISNLVDSMMDIWET